MSGLWLDRLGRAGNRLPDPAMLFLAGTLVVMLLSHLAVTLD
ncbi:MAG: AbgT family transporter [Chromatiaceae bacterium]|nr:AbgT family transporter [Chromatiaceae bacterium]